MSYYHAGPRGLSRILPPSETGALSTASYGARRVCRKDRIYVTTSIDAAILFAAMSPKGTIYEVDPVNPIHDPDCSMVGLAFEAERATIIREIRPKGSALKKARKIMVSS